MHIHHLNCGTINVYGGVAIIGTGGLIKPARGVIHCLLVETDDGLALVDTGFGTRDFTDPTTLNNWFITLSGSPRDPAETALAQVRQLVCFNCLGNFLRVMMLAKQQSSI